MGARVCGNGRPKASEVVFFSRVALTTPPPPGSLREKQNQKKQNQVVSWYLKPTAKPGEVMTDMYYPVYAQGLYEALIQAKELGVPVYITETGCADKSDTVRPFMIDQYVRATLRAMRDGVDVRGFYYWVSLVCVVLSWSGGCVEERGFFFQGGAAGAGGGGAFLSVYISNSTHPPRKPQTNKTHNKTSQKTDPPGQL